MKRRLRDALPPFASNLFLILMISLNTFFISRNRLIPAVVIQTGISAAWMFNVRSVASGSWSARAGYVAGGVVGQACGILIARVFA